MTVAAESICDGVNCDVAVEQPRSGRRRRWCSERCRKRTLYSRPCPSCGEPMNGHNGLSGAPKLCGDCFRAAKAANAKWTRDRILAEGRRWRELTGRRPLADDWNRFKSRGERRRLLDELHERTGPWPGVAVVQRQFGSWSDFIAALGGESLAHDGGRGRPKPARTDELRTILKRLGGDHG